MDARQGPYITGVSVEAILLILIAFASIGIFTAKIIADGYENASSPVASKVVGLRHDAISASPSDTIPVDESMAVADQDRFSQRSAGALSDGDRALTIVRNGVTVLSPPLRVPVIKADAIEMGKGSGALKSHRKAPHVWKRHHYAYRARAATHRRVVRSDAFWRFAGR